MSLPPADSWLYSLVTSHWPRIAVGLVTLIGLAELLLGGITANSSLEFYLTAWAAVTGGTWFLFETAEKALGEEGRGRVVGWLHAVSLREGLESVPSQFALLFDRVFGERHLSRSCFVRSCAASMASLFMAYTISFAMGYRLVLPGESDLVSFGVGALAIIFFGGLANFIPDYVSLLETRWAIRWMQSGHRLAIVGFDLVATAVLSVVGMWVVYVLVDGGLTLAASFADFGDFSTLSGLPSRYVATLWGMVLMLIGVEVPGARLEGLFASSDGLLLRLSFLSAFFTSFWLWLYSASVALSRLLLRMNSGVGVLLRATDVDRQPFRSIGFVSVVVISILFVLGLPFVVL